MAAKKSGLGKGLNALFTDNAVEDNSNSVELLIDDITPNRDQPRKDFEPEALQELSDSIAQHGVLQPILVRPLFSGGYQLVAGERRWRASMMAGLTTIPAVIREMSDSEAMEYALIENLQRENLNPIEEAEGIKQLIDTYQMTQEQAAERLNKSREAVSNSLRLLKLPQQIRDYVHEGQLSSSHARTLLAIENEQRKLDIAKEAIEKSYSVRALEKIAKEEKKKAKQQSDNTAKPKGVEIQHKLYREVELQLSEIMGRPVRVKVGNQKGTLEIDFYSDQDLLKLARSIADW